MPHDSEKFAKKTGKIGGKEGKNVKEREKVGKKSKNREEKARFFYFAPPPQIGLATPLGKIH